MGSRRLYHYCRMSGDFSSDLGDREEDDRPFGAGDCQKLEMRERVTAIVNDSDREI